MPGRGPGTSSDAARTAPSASLDPCVRQLDAPPPPPVTDATASTVAQGGGLAGSLVAGGRAPLPERDDRPHGPAAGVDAPGDAPTHAPSGAS